MGGAQPLAVTMLDGVCLVVDVDAAPPRAPRRVALPRSRRARPRLRPARGRGGARGGRRPLDRHRRLGRRGLPRAARARRRARHRHRPDERARSARRLRAGRALARRCRRAARERPAALHRALARLDGRPLRRDGRVPGARRPRSSTTATACAPRRARAASTRPSPTPASSRPTCGRSSAPAPGPFRWAALSGDPDDIAATDAAVGELFPENEHLQRWLELARTRIAYQGLPARICWLGYGERHRAGPALQRARALGRGQRADRDRPRPPRLGLRRLALPRDRGDDGRLGRDRRLADPERAARRLLGRGLGRRAPRRRRRHRPLDPLGRAGRRRRHRRGRAARSSACSRTIPARA